MASLSARAGISREAVWTQIQQDLRTFIGSTASRIWRARGCWWVSASGELDQSTARPCGRSWSTPSHASRRRFPSAVQAYAVISRAGYSPQPVTIRLVMP